MLVTDAVQLHVFHAESTIYIVLFPLPLIVHVVKFIDISENHVQLEPNIKFASVTVAVNITSPLVHDVGFFDIVHVGFVVSTTTVFALHVLSA